MESGLILLVEDDEHILRVNRRILQRAGYTVLCAATLAQAQALLREHSPDALVLDIMLPDGSGLDFCRGLCGRVAAPVLFLTALDEKHEVVEGLRAGGSDYITKPYDVNEFLARVGALIRLFRASRRAGAGEQALAFGRLTLDPVARRASLAGEDLLLTQKEFALLLTLARAGGQTLSADNLYRLVWGQPMASDNRTLKKHLSAVRKKLEAGDGGYTIEAVYGRGYAFVRREGER